MHGRVFIRSLHFEQTSKCDVSGAKGRGPGREPGASIYTPKRLCLSLSVPLCLSLSLFLSLSITLRRARNHAAQRPWCTADKARWRILKISREETSERGGALQVERFNPVLEAPGTTGQRLNLYDDELLSSFCIQIQVAAVRRGLDATEEPGECSQVGRCRLAV